MRHSQIRYKAVILILPRVVAPTSRPALRKQSRGFIQPGVHVETVSEAKLTTKQKQNSDKTRNLGLDQENRKSLKYFNLRSGVGTAEELGRMATCTTEQSCASHISPQATQASVAVSLHCAADPCQYYFIFLYPHPPCHQAKALCDLTPDTESMFWVVLNHDLKYKLCSIHKISLADSGSHVSLSFSVRNTTYVRICG